MTPIEVTEWILQDWYHVFLAWLFWAGFAFSFGFLTRAIQIFWEYWKNKS